MPVAAANFRKSAPTVSFCAIAAAVICVGVGGLQPDEAGAPARFGTGGVAFGLALCGLVLLRFYWRTRFGTPLEAQDIRGFSRISSRVVYVTVYCVVGAAQAQSLLRGTDIVESSHALRGYLACTLAALVLIRVLAVLARRSLPAPVAAPSLETCARDASALR